MTPLHLRRRLRSALTTLRGVSPDEAAEVRAAYRVAYDCGDDEPIADLMRHVLDEVAYQKRARDATDRALAEAADERDKLRTELADVDEALCAALDINPASLQAATMYAPGGVRRLAAERDAAAAMISTVRAELAAAVEERDRALDSAREAVAGEAAMRGERDRLRGTLGDVLDTLESHAFHDALTAVRDVLAAATTPKRKRTKEERAKVTSAYLADVWAMSPTGMGAAIRREIALMGPSTSRDIATRMWARIGATPDEAEIRNDMRWVQDFARAGYLTVAKGPGGVRVYSLKEGSDGS